MTNKICLITGATSGIGKAAAHKLATMGVNVVLVGRNPQKTAQVAAEIKAATGNGTVDFLIADLSIQAEIRRLAAEFCAKYARLDLLINNAGGIFQEYGETADGIERTFALNHLNYFLLTNLLLDRLKASAPARIVNISSGAHDGGTINWDDLNLQQTYSPFGAYAQSKLANILFTTELARKLTGSGVTANVLHPGFVATNFGSGMKGIMRFVWPVISLFALSPEKGADTIVYLATDSEVAEVSGGYFTKRKKVQPSSLAEDEAVAQRLWDVSVTLCSGVDAIS